MFSVPQKNAGSVKKGKHVFRTKGTPFEQGDWLKVVIIIGQGPKIIYIGTVVVLQKTDFWGPKPAGTL